MANITLEWTEENRPEWDGSGTIATSWYASHGRYTCRIDEFEAAEDGGYAYTVDADGNPIRGGENEPADSWEAAEQAIVALLTR